MTKRICSFALALLTCTLALLCFAGCKPTTYSIQPLQYEKRTTFAEQDMPTKGPLDLQGAPYYLKNITLEFQRITKVEFVTTTAQVGQQFTLYVVQTSKLSTADVLENATVHKITLDETNFTQTGNLASITLANTVVYVGRHQTLAFFDPSDTLPIEKIDVETAASCKDGTNACLAASLYTHSYAELGTTISVLGDSISTFDGISNDATTNTTIDKNIHFYPRYDITESKMTWWSLSLDMTKSTLCVNNSWSRTRVSSRAGKAFDTRCVNLHNDLANTDPQIIAVYMGTNDFCSDVEVGSFKKLNDVYEKGQYIDPTNFAQAYAIMVHKMTKRYPNSTICLFTLPENGDKVDVDTLQQYNETITYIADYFGCYVVDLQQMEEYHYTTHTTDKMHPNQQGMLQIADHFCRRLQVIATK